MEIKTEMCCQLQKFNNSSCVFFFFGGTEIGMEVSISKKAKKQWVRLKWVGGISGF